MAKQDSPHRWPIPEPSADWSASRNLSELGNLIQDRVETWHRPPREEMNEDRPDFDNLEVNRFWFSFERELEDDLRRVSFEQAIIWLKVHAPGIAGEVEEKIGALLARLPIHDPDTPETMIPELANVAFYLVNVADTIEQVHTHTTHGITGASGETRTIEICGLHTDQPVFPEITLGGEAITVTTPDKQSDNAATPESKTTEVKGDGDGENTTDTRAILESLQPAQRKAYLSYQLAESKAGRRLEDRKAYDKIHEEGFSDDAGDLGELTDYDLPSFDTWSRHLRNARERLGEQKNTRRAGRSKSRSIVRQNEV